MQRHASAIELLARCPGTLRIELLIHKLLLHFSPSQSSRVQTRYAGEPPDQGTVPSPPVVVGDGTVRSSTRRIRLSSISARPSCRDKRTRSNLFPYLPRLRTSSTTTSPARSSRG